MANALSVQKYSPPSNPDKVFLKVTVTGNYTNGTADPLNLTPNTWTDPLGLGVIGPETVPQISPSLWSENDSGYYAQVIKAATLSGFGLRWYQPGGTELASGAFPAAITGGDNVLELMFSPIGLV